MSDGNFSRTTLPRCEGYPPVSHGEAVHPDAERRPPFDAGTTLTLRCHPGYALSQSAEMPRCVAGAWQPAVAACVPKSCGAPPSISHGRVLGSLHSFAQAVEYACDDGYSLSGPSRYYCSVDSRWVPSGAERLRCEPASCPELEEWTGKSGRSTRLAGEEEVSGTLARPPGRSAPGTLAEYRCRDGFRISDPPSGIHSSSLTRRCGADGRWSGSVPACERIVCPDLPGLLVAPRVGGGSRINQIRCADGKEYTVKCRTDGTWTISRCPGETKDGSASPATSSVLSPPASPPLPTPLAPPPLPPSPSFPTLSSPTEPPATKRDDGLGSLCRVTYTTKYGFFRGTLFWALVAMVSTFLLYLTHRLSTLNEITIVEKKNGIFL